MNQVIKCIISFALTFSLLCIGASAVSDESFVFAPQTKIVVNDQDIESVPIIYNGRTYINARDLAPWLDMDIDYNGSTKTVSLSNAAYQNSLNESTIMTVDGHEIALGKFNAYAKWNLFFAGLTDLSSTQKDSFKSFVRDELIDEVAIAEVAKQNGIELTAEDYAKINQQIEEDMKKFNDKEDFISYLYNDVGISYLNYYFIQESAYLRELVKDSVSGVYTQNQLLDYYNNHQSAFQKDNATVKHILFQTTDADGNILPYQEKKVVEEKALRILDNINTGKITFDQAMKLYSDDSSANSAFLAKEGGVQPEFWRGITDTDEGTVSSLVETKYGYHIIKVDKKSDILPFDEVKEDISEVMRNEALNTILKSMEENFSITYQKDVYDSYTIF